MTFGSADRLPESVRVVRGVGSPRPATLEVITELDPHGRPWPAWIPKTPIPLSATLDPAPDNRPRQVFARLVGPWGDRPALSRDPAGTITLHVDPWQTIDHLTGERQIRFKRPLHTHAAGLIGLLPGPVRLAGHEVASRVEALRHGKIRAQPTETKDFLTLPADPSVETVRCLARRALGLDDAVPWPDGRPPLVLCHDVDTADGQKRILPIARQEEALGLRSCWYIVGDRYPVDHGLMQRLRDAGHEIGLHGTHHDQKLAYLPEHRVEARLDRCRDLMQRHDIVGFRSPALLMSDPLARVLARRFLYDSSVPDMDIGAISAPRRGCSSVFPFWRGPLLELPLTAPLDDRLMLLGCDPAGIHTVWTAKVAWVTQVGGMAVLTTHTEPHLGGDKKLRAAYGRLLQDITQQIHLTPTLPRDVARWWLDETTREVIV